MPTIAGDSSNRYRFSQTPIPHTHPKEEKAKEKNILNVFLAKRNGNIKIRIFAENVRVAPSTKPGMKAHSDGYDDINCY